MAVGEPRRGLYRALGPREVPQPIGTEAAPDPEADHVAGKAAEPAYRDQRTETEGAGVDGKPANSVDSRLCEAA